MDDYESLHGKQVGLVVDALVTNALNTRGSHSLELEGTLEKETGLQVLLRNVKTRTISGSPSFQTPQLYVNKNKIVLLYLIEEPAR